MATELEAYAAYCRKMAKAEHRPDCPPAVRRAGCGGACITMADRALWLLLAVEAETYLRAHEPETLPL